MRRLARWLWPAPWTLVGLALGALACAAGARMRVADGAIEISGGWLGRRAASGCGPWGLTAITLGHVILGACPEQLAALRTHEQVHVRQYERWGPFFVPAYLAWSAALWLRGRDAYLDNPFEREARGLPVSA